MLVYMSIFLLNGFFTWKTKQVFALEARMKWKKNPLPHEHHSCPQHQLPEEIRAGVFVPLRLQQAKPWFFGNRIKSEGCGGLLAKCKLGPSLHTAEFVRNEDFFHALPTPQARNKTRTTRLWLTAPASGATAGLCPGLSTDLITVVGIALLLLGFNHVAGHAAVHRKEGFLKFGGDLEIWRQGEENCGLKGI